MFQEEFKMVLQKDEEIKWANKSNVVASVLKGLIPVVLLGTFASVFICAFIAPFTEYGESDGAFKDIFKPVLIIVPAIAILYIFYASLNARNTYFCITNKRIIKRTGAFNNNFIHYTLKNVGTIQVVGGAVDSNGSATLLVTTKDFHIDSKGNSHPTRLKVSSLCDAYEAYNILSELVEGNNETLRVEIQK